MRISVKNCIGYTGQIPKNHDFRNIEKSAPSKIEILVEISMLFYDMVNRPTSGDLNPIFDTDFSRRVRCYQFPICLMVPERLYQTSAETLAFSSFATSLRNHILHRTEEILLFLLLLPGFLWDPRGVPVGSQSADP